LKAGMSSFDVWVTVSELNKLISDSRIRNIYQLSPSTILFKLYKLNEQVQLLIEAGKRFHLTRFVHEKPLRPPTFCMALRKYLRNGRIIEITQHEFERIAILKVNTKTGEMQLIIEIFGEGNLILINSNNHIVQALKYRRMRDRNILRGESFLYPPSSGKNPFKLKLEEMKEELKRFGEIEVVRALTKFLSIGGVYAEEILERANVEKITPCNSLTQTAVKRIFKALNQILTQISHGKTDPTIVVDETGEYMDVTPIRLQKYSQYKHIPYESFNIALDEFYGKTGSKEKVAVLSEQLERQIAKHERILKTQKEALEKAQKQIENNRKIGDAIYVHMHELQQLMNFIMKEKKNGKSWKEITSEIKMRKSRGKKPEIYFESLTPQQLILTVSVENMTFPLNLRKTIQENASNFYSKAKKAEKKLEGIISSMHKTERTIKALRVKSVQKISEAKKIEPLKTVKREWYEKFRWCYSSEGFLMIGGRDATTNEMLIKRHTEPRDIVFHADIIGAPFVIVKTQGKTPTEQTLQEAAQFAGAYSRAWKQKLSAIDVYWVKPEQVSKQPPSGQFLSKGAFMIRGKKNYIKKTPLKIAIGIMKKEKTPKIIGGPPSAIAKNADTYVEIVPNDTTVGKLAEQVLGILTKKIRLELSKQLRKFLIEEIHRFLPAGKGKIVKESTES